MNTVHVEPHRIGGTIAYLAFTAVVTGLIGLVIAFMAAAIPLALSGPLGWLIGFPVLLASFTVALNWVLIGAPLVALGLGFVFANRAATHNGPTQRALDIRYFDDDHPIRRRLDELASALHLPRIPYVGWYPSPDINAFALGVRHDNMLIAFTDTAINSLTKTELDAVMAHELAHVASHDMHRLTLIRGVQEGLTFFLIARGLKKTARWVFSPLAELELLHLSRQREFHADRVTAELISPDAMAGALTAVERHMHQQNPDYAPLQISGIVQGWLRTHPPIAERVLALKALQPTSAINHVAPHEEHRSSGTEKVCAPALAADAPSHPVAEVEQGIPSPSPPPVVRPSDVQGVLSFGA